MSAVSKRSGRFADDGVDAVKFLMVAGENPILAVGHPFTSPAGERRVMISSIARLPGSDSRRADVAIATVDPRNEDLVIRMARRLKIAIVLPETL